MNVINSTTDVAQDQLRQHALLGTRATYRVVSVTDVLATLQVVDVPGLPAGMDVRMALDEVRAMPLVEDVRTEVDRALDSLLAGARRPERAAA